MDLSPELGSALTVQSSPLPLSPSPFPPTSQNKGINLRGKKELHKKKIKKKAGRQAGGKEERKNPKDYMVNRYSCCAYVNTEAMSVNTGLILQTN